MQFKNTDKKAEKKRVITKILKIDENSQYGNGMAKPLPTGCTKGNSDISWETFNFLLEKVDFEDTISHLYIAGIEFDKKKKNYPPIIEKQKIIDPCERLVFQLLEQYIEGEKGPKFYRSSAKVHATFLKKNFLPMYLEDLAFCIKIKKADWKVTKIYSHLTFEQVTFKRKFILMN